MEKIWKEVPGFNGDYQINESGEVRSTKFNKIRILVQVVSANGYKKVHLCEKGNKPVTSFIHVLMGIVYLKHEPNGNTYVIHHKDEIKTNNELSNLKRITHRENISISKKNKTSKYTGVCKKKGAKKWNAQIIISGKKHWLGTFETELAASIAYKNALKLYV